MYISHAFSSSDRDEPLKLQGLSDDTADLQALQTSLAAIKAALDLNPKGGYVSGSPARKQLEKAFESVPVCSALALAQQLMNGTATLEKLFRYRLASATQRTMLLILVRKAKECQLLAKQELRRQQEEQRRKQLEVEQIRQALCANVQKTDNLVDKLCKLTGEGSEECRNARAKALQHQEQLRADGIRCP